MTARRCLACLSLVLLLPLPPVCASEPAAHEPAATPALGEHMPATPVEHAPAPAAHAAAAPAAPPAEEIPAPATSIPETTDHAPATDAASHAGAAGAVSAAELNQSLLSLATKLADRDDFEGAEIAYRQVLGNRRSTVADQQDALLGLARLYRRQSSLTKATAAYEKFVKEFPDSDRVPDALLELGRTLRALGTHKLAISKFYSVINSTLKLQADGATRYQVLARTAQFEIAQTHFEAGNYDEAGKYFSRLRLLDLSPSDRARAHFMAAQSRQLSGDLDGAVGALRAYLEQWPDAADVAEARHVLATTFRTLGRNQEALAVTLELLRLDRAHDSPTWAYWQRRTGNELANGFFQSGEIHHALSLYQGLANLSADPTWRLPALYQVALCYERLRLVPQAVEIYQQILATAAAPAPRLAAQPEAGSPPAQATGTGDANASAPVVAELARMAQWRLDHLDWRETVDARLDAFFKASPAEPAPTPPPLAAAHDPAGSPAATPAAL